MNTARPEVMSNVAPRRPLARKLLNVGIEVAVNFIAPLLVYDYFEGAFGEVTALAMSCLPPMLWAAAEFIRHRRVDAISLFVLASILLSGVALAGGGSVRMLQIRENLVAGAIGLALIGSVVVGRPLAYQFARAGIARKSPEDAAAFEAKKDNPRFQRSMTVMTLVWGSALLASTVLACALVMKLSVREYIVVSPFINYATMGALAIWTFLYVRHVRKPRHDGQERSSAA